MGQGAVATVLVQKGTLKVSDIVVAGSQWGRVKALTDASGDRMEEGAGPSVAVELVGLNGLPAAGDQLMVVEDEAKARAVADVRQALDREKRASQLFAARSTADRELFLGGLKEGELPTKVPAAADHSRAAAAAATAAGPRCEIGTKLPPWFGHDLAHDLAARAVATRCVRPVFAARGHGRQGRRAGLS